MANPSVVGCGCGEERYREGMQAQELEKVVGDARPLAITVDVVVDVSCSPYRQWEFPVARSMEGECKCRR